MNQKPTRALKTEVLREEEFHEILSGLECGANFEDLSEDVDDE